MNRNFSFNYNSLFRNVCTPALLLQLLLAFFFSSCAGIDQSVKTMKDYLPDIEMEDFANGEDTSNKKARISEIITPLKKANFIFSPIISLKDLNKKSAQKNKFFLAGEIYSKYPEEAVSSLSKDNCFSPGEQDSINKLDRLYHVFIKDLGLNSANVNEIDANDKIDTHFLIQPVLLKYQYCKRAVVEIRYLIQSETKTQTARTIKTSHKAENFNFPEKDKHHPFFNYNHPGTQFSGLRHALAMAFYKNTLDLIEMISEEYNGNETK